MIHTVKDFGIVNKAEIDVFLELSWAPKYIKQMLKGIKGETDGKTITVGDFNTPLTSVDHSRQKINKATKIPNETIKVQKRETLCMAENNYPHWKGFLGLS